MFLSIPSIGHGPRMPRDFQKSK